MCLRLCLLAVRYSTTKISHHVNYIWDNRECQEPRGVSKFGGVKRDRNITMMKLRGYGRIPDRGGKVERSGEGRESIYAKNAMVEKWKMSAIGCCVAMYGTL